MILSFNQYLLESTRHGSDAGASKWEGWLSNLVQWAGGTFNIARAHDEVYITINIQLDKNKYNIVIDPRKSMLYVNYQPIKRLDLSTEAGKIEPFIIGYVMMAMVIIGSKQYDIFDNFNRQLQSIYWSGGEPEKLVSVFMEIDARLQERGAAPLDRGLLPVLMQPLELSPEEASDYAVLIDLGLL
jgi:hypothetical protein